jgi:hypothetical protein
VTAHRLAGHFTVDESARRIRNYRYAEERMMRILGGWIALTPELPAKLLFGRHVWDCAQHADLWGRRLPELRAPAQQSEPANPAFVAFMDTIDGCETPGQTLERLVAVYRVLKPHLVTAYQRHLATTNPVYEPPTRRILERCADEERRHVAAGAAVLPRLFGGASLEARARDWERRLLDALEAAGGVTGDVDAPLVAVTGPEPDAAVVAQDIVRVPPDFDPAQVDAGLAAVVQAHARALAAGDTAAVARDVAAGAADAVAAQYARLPRGLDDVRLVAAAKVGRHRVVKVRLSEGTRAVVIQQRWIDSPAGWRLVGAELSPAAPTDGAAQH